MAKWWNEVGHEIAWYFCTFGLPVIIAAWVYSEL